MIKKTTLLIVFIAVFTTIASATSSITQGNYRWRNDDGSIENATAQADENVDINSAKDINIRLRVELYTNDTDTVEYTAMELYYSIDSTNWTQITNDGNNEFQLSLSTYYDESDTINDMLSNSEVQPHGGGFTIESTVSKAFTFYPEKSYEVEYCIKATSNAVVGTTYQFAVENGLNYTTYPELTIVSSNLSVNPSLKGVSNSPGTTTPFLVTSNTNWTISDNATWLNTSKNSGSGNDSFTATYTENTLPNSRNATITVAASGVPDVELLVIQSGSPVPLNTIVHNATITNGQTECYNATSTIIVAGSGTTVDILSGGQATFIAGQKIFFEPGFLAHAGSYCHGYITETADYCRQPPPLVSVQNPTEEEVKEEEVEEEKKVGRFPEFLIDDDAEVNIYPNPTLGKFTIDFTVNETTADIMLMNLHGNSVYETRCENENKKSIDISHLPGGMYIIVIKSNNQIFTKKIIKNY